MKKIKYLGYVWSWSGQEPEYGYTSLRDAKKDTRKRVCGAYPSGKVYSVDNSISYAAWIYHNGKTIKVNP